MSIEPPNMVRHLAEQAIDEALVDLSQRRARASQASASATRTRAARLGLMACVPTLLALVYMRVPASEVVLRTITATTADRTHTEDMLAEVVEDVRLFRADYAQLPKSLAEVGRPTQGMWTYTTLADGRFRLSVIYRGHEARFDGR